MSTASSKGNLLIGKNLHFIEIKRQNSRLHPQGVPGPKVGGEPNLQRQESNVLWCYTCDRPTAHEIRYRSDPKFTGKLLVCRECGETIKQLLGGPW